MSSKLFCKIHKHLASAPSLRVSKQLSWFHCQRNECPRTVLYKLSRMIKGLAGRHDTARMTVWSSFPYVHAVLHSMLNVHWEAPSRGVEFSQQQSQALALLTQSPCAWQCAGHLWQPFLFLFLLPCFLCLLPPVPKLRASKRRLVTCELLTEFVFVFLVVQQGHQLWLEIYRSPDSLLFLINFYWSIVALQCCVRFCWTAKWSRIHVDSLLVLRFSVWVGVRKVWRGERWEVEEKGG